MKRAFFAGMACLSAPVSVAMFFVAMGWLDPTTARPAFWWIATIVAVVSYMYFGTRSTNRPTKYEIMEELDRKNKAEVDKLLHEVGGQ